MNVSFLQFVKRNIYLPLIGAITVLYIYGLRIFNLNIGIDSEFFLGSFERSRVHWLAMGRYGLVLLQYVFKNTDTNECADTFVACTFLLISGLLLCYIFKLILGGDKNVISYSFFLVFYLSSSVWVEMIYFAYMSAEVMFAVMLCPIMVLLTINRMKLDKDILFSMGMAVLVMFITSIYQAALLLFVAELAAAYLLILEKSNTLYKKSILRSLVFVIAGTVLYFAIRAIIRSFLHTDATYLESMVHLGDADYIFRIGAFLFELFGADVPFLNSFVYEKVGALAGTSYADKVYWNSTISCALYCPMLIVFLIMVIKNSVKNGKLTGAIQFLCGITVPASVLFLAVLGGNVEVRTLYSLAFVGAFVFFYICINVRKENVRKFLYLIIAAAVYVQIQRSALMIYSDQLRYQYDIALTEAIIREASEVYSLSSDSVEESIPLYIYGKKDVAAENNYRFGRVIGHSIYSWEGAETRAISFMHDIGHRNVIVAEGNGEEFKNICADIEMPVFPEKGSVRYYNGIVVVKLSR